jgi:hypothetical protein
MKFFLLMGILIFSNGLMATSSDIKQFQYETPTTSNLFSDWRPTEGSRALGIDAFNGTGISLSTWYSSQHSENDTLLFNGNGQYFQPQDKLLKSSADLLMGYGFSIISLQRWRLWKLGRFGDLDFVAGPFISTGGSGYFNVNQGPRFMFGDYSYSVGVKTGLETECYILPGWSLDLGYLLTVAGGTGGPDGNLFISDWSFSFGSAQVGLNYYFRE